MKVTVHQPQFLPWLGYLDKIARADLFVVLDQVQFKKQEWQNRNRIRTACEWQWLTVPVLQRFGQRIEEVRVNRQVDWRRQHLRALTMHYAKAPYQNHVLVVSANRTEAGSIFKVSGSMSAKTGLAPTRVMACHGAEQT